MLEIVPNSYIKIERVATNYNHSVDEIVRKRLEKENIWAPYYAWNFYGLVWFDKEKKIFKCMIKQRHEHIETIEAKTIKQIMKIASDKYGHD